MGRKKIAKKSSSCTKDTLSEYPFDWEGLTPIYSPSSEATYFNLNGHTYNGRDHWIRLWKFYGQNVTSTYWTPFDIGAS